MTPAGMVSEVGQLPKTNGTTLVGYLLSVSRSHMNHLEGGIAHTTKGTADDDGVQDLITLLTSITVAVKSVGALVRTIGINPIKATEDGLTAAERATGEIEALNGAANRIWLDALLYSQKTCVLVSEDLPEPVIVEESMRGKYAVVFDPLTGLASPPSQDMGCIFGIFRKLTPGKAPGLEDIMQPGRNLVAAGYALYGSCTVLMFSVGDGVHAFTLDASLNEFILTEEHVKIPFSGNIYSINEGRTQAYDHQTQEMLKCLKAEPALDGRVRTCRYIGSMVADIHRTIVKGGIFMYPPHKQGYPDGRLKLLYEAGPMAFLVTQAGGSASTGTKNITDIQPESIHTKVPVFLGSEDDVNFACGFYKTAPWGRTSDDPMFQLRRTLSIEERDPMDDDGVICFHVG